MDIDWLSTVGGAVVAVTGIAFSWRASRRGEAHAAALARANNEHGRALTELAYAHARSLELMRYEQQEQQHRRQRVADAYLDIAEKVLRAGRIAELSPERRQEQEEGLTRALSLASLHAVPEVKAAFDDWYDRYQKVVFALDRLHGDHAMKESEALWRRQLRDGKLREADARERLLTAMASQLAPETPTRSDAQPKPS